MRTFDLVRVAVACATLGGAAAVVPAFGQTQQHEDVEPGVNTSALPPQAPVSDANSAKSVTSKPADQTAAASTARTAAAADKSGKPAKAGKVMDRIDLDTIHITGNKELPSVMYVVPWKRSDLGDLTGKPANSLVDEVLQPVDRDVFNRQERYYHTVAPEKTPPGADPGTPADH